MNYLGHAYLSFGNADILCGNMIGDYIKGMDALDHFPEGIRKGLLLHRHIDSFTDQHPAIREAKKIFRPVYGLYSGAVVDTLTDHFLANDPALFQDEETLERFTEQVYEQLHSRSEYFPEKFKPLYQSMITHKWLMHYRSEAGLKQSLNGLYRRAKHIEEMDSAFTLLLQHKKDLQALYDNFIGSVIHFVKIELQGD